MQKEAVLEVLSLDLKRRNQGVDLQRGQIQELEGV